MTDEPTDDDVQMMAGLIVARMLETVESMRTQGLPLGLLEFELAGCRILAVFDDQDGGEAEGDDQARGPEQGT
ncbi:hypothetical protein TVVG_00036 [Tetraselmis viridis virus SI1]|uniref:hypothetical protein n=1 Tax=Tetraselmis viridis virus S20 TaxID=754070 RepID=UPI0002C0E531|nr:hypothetical protein TVGG_00002 [Tetraselmis viridis virus S20]AGH31330.1 hypothetical protein TVGG_00002 [Tetraselmis viridis virus S20]AGH31419.1 hypothetical protein TVVG_00036 [Tetraselmis viridis virus SI1]